MKNLLNTKILRFTQNDKKDVLSFCPAPKLRSREKHSEVKNLLNTKILRFTQNDKKNVLSFRMEGSEMENLLIKCKKQLGIGYSVMGIGMNSEFSVEFRLKKSESK